jgi:hypothetical protein
MQFLLSKLNLLTTHMYATMYGSVLTAGAGHHPCTSTTVYFTTPVSTSTRNTFKVSEKCINTKGCYATMPTFTSGNPEASTKGTKECTNARWHNPIHTGCSDVEQGRFNNHLTTSQSICLACFSKANEMDTEAN